MLEQFTLFLKNQIKTKTSEELRIQRPIVFQKGVIKGEMKSSDTEKVVKGACLCSYLGCKNPALYTKYVINTS